MVEVCEGSIERNRSCSSPGYFYRSIQESFGQPLMTVRILLCFDVALFHGVLSEGVLGFNKLENNSWAVACTPGVKQGKEGLCKLPGKEVVHPHPCVAFHGGALS